MGFFFLSPNFGVMESVDIKDISGNLRFSTPINEGSKRHFLLMKEDYITLKFSSVEPVYFKLGDYIDNELGMFELVDLYKPAYNTTTGAYDYELRLDAYYWKWKNKKFFYTPETTGREAGWNLTAPLKTHLEVFLDNLKALGYKFRDEEFTYEIDNTVANISKLVSYDNVNLIDALTQMADTWECEWWIENKTIHFGRCEYSSPVDFKAGDLTDTENVNVNSMQRSDSQTTYATRVYAFGSTRNIPASYRKSLIFDVKKVKGRDISDTARPLDIKYFPISSQIKGADIDVSIKHTEMYDPDFPKRYTVTIAESLKAGKYLLKANGSTVEGYFQTTPPANSTTKAIFTLEYNNGDSIKLAEMTVQNRDSWPEFKLVDMPFTLNGDALNCRLSISLEYSFSKWLNVQYKGILTLSCETPGANTSVTFLSGSNAGQTFDAVYNPDLLTGDNSNVIRLPEGVTTSLNDRYTINNIIKGKVPDNYFSKDDKELTLNGVVQKRLMLPEGIPYVDAYRYSPTGERIDIGDERYDNPDNVEMPEEEAIEEIVIFEDEYPKYIGSVSSISHEEKEEIDEETKKPTGNKYPIYTFKDYGLKNFTKDFLLEELHLIFQTGKLAGLDFALNLKESDNTGTTFEIVRNEDYGRALPDDTLFPQAAHMEDGEEVPADTYVLYGFDTAFISEQMLPDAEQELLKKAKEYVKKSMIDPSTYDCEMDADFIYNKGNIRTYEVGAKVNLINKAFFPEGRQSRIIGFEWPLDIPYDHPIYTVGETASYSRIGEIESKLDSLTYKGQTYSGSVVGGGGTSIYVIGVNDKTLPSDRNVFSSQKSLATFLNKTQEETMDYLIKLLGGVITDKIESQNFISGALGTGFLVKRDPKTGRSYAEFDEIYVRLKAVFESLTIKELQSVGGEILLTLASIECTKVEKISVASVYDSSGARLYDSDNAALYVPVATGGVYRCYFTADDGEKAIINQFAAGDMAQCRQFNIKPGVYENVSNRYYWRYVLAVGENYIDLSVDDCEEGSDIPQAGDKIIQLGHRTDPARQNAILLSAYGLTAPTIQMLQGIDSYTLDGKAVKEEGFDQETQQFYSNSYGRSYTGARDESSYMKFTPDEGVVIKGNVELTDGSKVFWKNLMDSPEWIDEWTTNGTSIGDKFVASPEGFFGRKSEDGKLTGVLLGKDVTVDGEIRTGIFALVDDKPVFELDPITKQYKFTGQIYSDNGRIGGFDIGSFSLENKDGQDALIRIINDSRKTTAALGNTIPGIAGFGCGSYFEASDTGASADNRAVMIRASGSTEEFWGGGKRNISIDSVGGCNWRMAQDDFWRMPGVLFGTRITVESNGSPHFGIGWGNGIDSSEAKISVNTASKIFTFTHGLGHTRYFTFVTPSGQRAAGDYDPCTPSVDNIADTNFTLSFWGNGNYERVYPLYFDMIIVGVPSNKEV